MAITRCEVVGEMGSSEWLVDKYVALAERTLSGQTSGLKGDRRLWLYWSSVMIALAEIGNEGRTCTDVEGKRERVMRGIDRERAMIRNGYLIESLPFIGAWRAARLVEEGGFAAALKLYTDYGKGLDSGFRGMLVVGPGLFIHEAEDSANLEWPRGRMAAPLVGHARVRVSNVDYLLVGVRTQVHKQVVEELREGRCLLLPGEWYKRLEGLGEVLEGEPYDEVRLLETKFSPVVREFGEVIEDVRDLRGMVGDETGMLELVACVARQAACGVKWSGAELECLWTYPEALARRGEECAAGMGMFIRWDPVLGQPPGGNGIGRPPGYREALSGAGWRRKGR